MQQGIAGFLRVGDAPELAAAGQFAGVADLAAHLGVAGAGVEDDGGLVLERDDFQDLGLHRKVVVADEFVGVVVSICEREMTSFFCAARARARCSSINFSKPVLVHGQTAFARHQFGEVERETVGVVKLESANRSSCTTASVSNLQRWTS